MAYFCVRFYHEYVLSGDKKLLSYPPLWVFRKFIELDKVELLDYLTTGVLILLIVFSFILSKSVSFAGGILFALVAYAMVHAGIIAVYTVYFLTKMADDALSLHYVLGYLSISAFFIITEKNYFPILVAGAALLFISLIRLRDDASAVPDLLNCWRILPIYVLYPMTFIYGLGAVDRSSIPGLFFSLHFVKYILAGIAIVMFHDIIDPAASKSARRPRSGNDTLLFSVIPFSILFNAVFVLVLMNNFVLGVFLYSYSRAFWKSWKKLVPRPRQAASAGRRP